MKLLICLIGALLATTIAAPIEPRGDSNVKDILDSMKIVKDPKTYEEINKHIDPLKELDNIALHVEALSHLADIDKSQKEEFDRYVKLGNDLKTIMATAREVGLASLVEGAKYDEAKLTTLAKELANAIHIDELMKVPSVRDDLTFEDEVLKSLQQLILQNPVKESGNNFLDILKEKIPSLYIVAKRIRTVDRLIKAAIKNYEKIAPSTENPEEAEKMSDFRKKFFLREFFTVLSSEENAVEIFKNFGIFADTFKSESSYESLEAMYNALARSKRLESYAILVREAGKCLGAELTAEERAEFHDIVKKALKVAKVLFADGQDTSKVQEMDDEFTANYEPRLLQLWGKIGKSMETTEGRKRFSACFVTDEDREIFKKAVKIPNPVLSDDDLSAMREKNEKVYALVNIVNGFVKAVRSRGGLGAEADAFFKEMVTTSNSLLRIGEFMHPSQETLEAIAAHKKLVIEKFNAMSDEAKKEFVEKFPFRSLINLALLD